MSEWNLSVRLTGQGSDLAATLRESATEARKLKNRLKEAKRAIKELRQEAANGITVRLDVDSDHLRSDVTAALTSASSGQGIRIRLDIDADHLRDEVQAAVTAAGAGQGLPINLRIADPMQLRRDVSDAVRWASMNQTVRVRIDPDTSALNGLTTTLNAGSSSSSSSSGGLLKNLLLLAPAAIPLLAGLSANLAPLAGQFAATGFAATAFGAALAGQVSQLAEVSDAQEKYDEAVREHGAASAEAIKAQVVYQNMLAELPPETQKAAVALTGLKQTFSDWSDDMSGFTMAPVTKGFTVLEQIIPALSPEVESFSGQLDRLMNIAGGAVSSPGFDAFSNKVAQLTDQKLDAFTDQVIHLLRVLSEGDAGNGAIGQILDYMRQNGPAAREAIEAIGDAVSTLAQGAADAGPTMLTLVTAAARLVAALPPELVTILIQAATALKLFQLAGAGMAAVGAAAGRASTTIRTLGTTAAGAGGGIAGLRAALASLSTGAKVGMAVAALGGLLLVLKEFSDNKPAVEVDALSTSLNTLISTGKVTGALKTNFQEISESIAMVSKGASDNKLAQLTSDFGTWIGIATGPGISTARENVDAWDKSMAQLVKAGHPEQAAAQYELLKKAWVAGGGDLERLKKFTTDYDAALADAAFEQQMAAQSMGLFGQAALDTQAKLDAQKQSADGLRQSVIALNEVNRAAGSAMSAFEQSIDDTTAAMREHAGALKMRDGELDLGSQKARDAEKVLSDLAANTDAAATAAREQGKSWEYVTGIQDRGRAAFIKAADAMGLSKAQAEALASTYLNIPDKKTTSIEMRTEDAVAGLDAVIAEIEKTPDSKSVTVKALTADAQSMLRGLGFEVTQLKDGSFKVTASTATAQESLAGVQRMRDGLADKSITISAHTQDTINSLSSVQAKVASTKGKTITMAAPTAAARHQLELLGFKIRDTKGKNVVISVPTGSQRANVSALAGAIAALRNKTVTITTNYVVTGSQARRSGSHGSQLANARGGVWDYYADGGIRSGRRGGGVSFYAGGGMEPGDRPNRHVAQIAPAGSWRVWGEPETDGEGYVPFRRSARPRSRAITEEIVSRLGGDPSSIQWNAAGSVTDWRYDPQTGSLYSGSDITSAGNKTRKVKVRGKGGKVTIKEIEYFDLGAVEKKLKSAAKATQAWNADLQKVADRAGGDVAEALASMGKEGMRLADKMANGSTKYLNDMSKALRELQKIAKASLTDYTRQLGTANKMNKDFADDLAKLAAMGYGDLAAQLAEQNDTAAQQLADAAVKDKGKAAKANAQAKTANSALTADQVQTLVQIIAAIKTNKTGIHDVAATTGLGEDDIIEVANKAKRQISTSLGSRADRFMTDLIKANRHMAYADGGIRAGMYATRGGIIRFAEPETHGEAYLPLSPSKRRSALPVLHDVAARFGVGLTDAQSSRVVIIREQGPMVGASHFHIGDRRSDRDLARDIEARQSYQLRRLARGGAFAGSAGGGR
ncbi:hypothetical protein [Streptomyces collinus]|uniref:hypothetical protein n=1 Tax=Streptomyces collinus TaxID=42684 RepID=UPI003822870D